MRISLIEKINPCIKMITVLICCIILALTASWKVNAILAGIILLSLLFLSHCSLKRLFCLLAPVALLSISIFVSVHVNDSAVKTSSSIYQVGSMDSALMLATRVLAYVGFGMFFAVTTNSTEFIMSLMHQAKLKPKFAYGVLAAVNLLPTLRREWNEVNLAYHARQKKVGLIPIKPLFNTLVNGIRWSESVAMAMESKGFDGDGTRSFVIETYIKIKDIVFILLCITITTVTALIFR